jgi:hypothetical protein
VHVFRRRARWVLHALRCVVLFMAERVHLCSSEWAARINCSQQSYWTLLVNRERF